MAILHRGGQRIHYVPFLDLFFKPYFEIILDLHKSCRNCAQESPDSSVVTTSEPFESKLQT